MNRIRMHQERHSLTHKFVVGELKGYVTVGYLEDGKIGEVFLTVHRVGSFERGLLHAIAIMISMLLQHGVAITDITDKLKGMAFEPAGFTANKQIPMVRSVLDYVAQWLILKSEEARTNGKRD